MRPRATSPRRALRVFWLLLTVAALAMGTLSAALTKASGPLTGLTVAGSGVILALALALACRIMIAFDHARRAAQNLAGGGSARSARHGLCGSSGKPIEGTTKPS